MAQEGGQVQLGFPKGLHLAVQTHGEVQVVDQVPDGLALPADDGGLVPAGRGQGGVGLQLSRIAHDHTQGGTDVVGDAVNPVRPGFIPGLLVLPEPAAQQKGGQGQHADQGEKEQEHPPDRQQVEDLLREGDGELPGASLGRACHQQTVWTDAGLDGVILQVPPGKGGDIQQVVLVRDLRRLVVLPQDLTSMSQRDCCAKRSSPVK